MELIHYLLMMCGFATIGTVVISLLSGGTLVNGIVTGIFVSAMIVALAIIISILRSE